MILLLLMSVSLLGIPVTLVRLLVSVTVAVALLSVSEQLSLNDVKRLVKSSFKEIFTKEHPLEEPQTNAWQEE